MKFEKKSLLILIVPLIIIAFIYPFLPEKIPRQFHLNGEPPTYMAKQFIFLFGFLPYVIYKSHLSKKK